MALLILAGCASQPPASPPADLIIIAPRMLDVRSGAYLENRAVIIRDGRIASIESAASAQKLSVTERLTLPAGTTLLPGLIDTHVHLAWTGAPNADAARLTLMAGFTTVRNPGATADDDLVLRRSIEDGSVIGPRMVIARAGIGIGRAGPREMHVRVDKTRQERGALREREPLCCHDPLRAGSGFDGSDTSPADDDGAILEVRTRAHVQHSWRDDDEIGGR
jgi:hypothetical protein